MLSGASESTINYNKRKDHKHPAFIWHLVLATCITTHLITYPATEATLVTASNIGVRSNTNTNIIHTKLGSTSSDIFNIRHGRSRVRHSNERWNLQGFNTNATLFEKDVDDDGSVVVSGKGNGNGNGNENGLGTGGVAVAGTASSSDGSSSISSGNGKLFGSDYWQNSDANGTLLYHLLAPTSASLTLSLPHIRSASFNKVKPTSEPAAQIAVTHKIRKLHKKKIMESIRKSVEEKGVKLPKNHRSLAEAEHLQGRVLEDDVDDNDHDDNDDDGDENSVANFEDLLMDAPEEDAEDAVEQFNQFDPGEYASTTTTTMITTTIYEVDKSDNLARATQSDENASQQRQQEENFDSSYVRGETTTDASYTFENEPKVALNANETIAKNQNIVSAHDDSQNSAIETANKQQKQQQQQKHEEQQEKRLTATQRSWSTQQLQPQVQNTLNAAAEQVSNTFTEPDEEYNLDDETPSKPVTTESTAAPANIEHDYHETASEQPTSANSNAFAALANNDNVVGTDTDDYDAASQQPFAAAAAAATTPLDEDAELFGFNSAASTSVRGIGLESGTLEMEEINLNGDDAEQDNNDDNGIGFGINDADDDDDNDDNSEDTMDDGIIDNRDNRRFPLNSPDTGDTMTAASDDTEDLYETNKFLEGVVDAANADEIYDWDEISRNNRRNLMRGRDVVTKFLQIVETQHSLGSNCEAGTSLNLGEGVVDRYAQDRFRVEAEVAVNRANMLTRIFKMTSSAVQASVNLLHTSVLSMVEFDDDIFAAGNCFDWNQHPSQPGLFCPFAYRLPPPNLGAIFAKDLATEYHYLGNTSEWFFQARKNAEKVIMRNEQYLKAFHLYSNKTDERIEDNTLAVKYEDGRWSKPYYDCGGGNIWMLTYTVPFFGYENGSYFFKGTSGIDIDLRRVDIDQCPQRSTPGTTQPLNIFAGTDKCKQRTTMCEALKGLGFRRGSYKCLCRKGYYFPDTVSTQKFFNGSLLEEEYEKLMLGKNSTYNIVAEYECLPCAEGCDSCEDGSPCIAALNWPMRTSILVLACTVIGLLPPAAWFTFRYQQVKVVRAASPALLRVIALGAFFIYCTTIVMYSNPNLYTCTARIWLREIGFSLTYGALMLKTWRISVIFRVRSAKAVKITDAALLKRLGVICGVIGTCLLVRTLVSPPDVVVGRTADDLKAFLCKTDWWDYTFTSMEVLFLAWGVRLCIMVRKAPSEFNESRFISMAIYNEFLLTCFLNVSMLFLQSPANPDLLYIIFFCHTQLTVTLLLGLIFGSKVYIVLRSGKSHQESIGLGAKSSGAKFNFRPQVRTFANPSSVTTSTAQLAGGTTSAEAKLSDQEALEEIRQLSVQLQRIQEMAPPKGVAVMTISSLLDGLKTPGGLMMVAAAAGSAGANQFALKQQQQQQQQQQTQLHQQSSLPLLALNNDLHKYNHPLQLPQNNNIDISHKERTATIAQSIVAIVLEDKSVNTCLTGEDFRNELLATQANFVCEHCLESYREHLSNGGSCRPSTPTLCQRLGSPQPEGSISFSNIKLECMCSHPDDIDRQHTASPKLTRRRVSQRSAATNTPPTNSRRRSKTKANSGSTTHLSSCASIAEMQKATDIAISSDTQAQRSDSETFPICDNCKNKFKSKTRRSSQNSKSSTLDRLEHKSSDGIEAAAMTTTSTTTQLTCQTCSNELLDRLGSTNAGTTKKVHSTDDVAFYTTTDDDDDDDVDGGDDGSGFDDCSKDATQGCQKKRRRRRCAQRQHELICQSTSALSTNVAIATCLAEFCAPSTSTSTVTGSSIAPTADTQQNVVASVTAAAAVTGAPTHSDGNISVNSNSSNSNNGNDPTKANGRSKRPDKLMLDLNDRSKYTKEVSV